MKIKLGGKPDEPPAERPEPERKPSMKISFKPKTPATEQPPSLEPMIEVKPKKQTGKKVKAPESVEPSGSTGAQALKLGKKRARKDSDAPDGELPAKRKVKPTERAGSISFRVPNKPAAPGKAPSLKLNTKIQPNTSGVKLKFSSAVPQSATTPLIKIRARGKVPKRDPGVGYDSEDEEAEVDPVIENHFILRMQPGEDCEYLRTAIAESAVKHKPDGTRALGPDVWMKFYDKEGRHGIVCVRGHMYAASLLDLPCIVETMKSWDKKGWYKTTDLCQILLVLGKIEKEEQAKNYPLPAEVDKENWQYPHGLTPPMQWVRKRRFRRRVNRRHIERVEADVEELIARDREWEKDYANGDASITLEYVDPDAPAEDEMDAEGEDDDYGFEYEDQDGNVYIQQTGGMEEEEDDDELAAALEAGLAGDDEDQEGEQTVALVADPSMLHASPDSLVPMETAITPGSGVTMSATEESGDDDEDDEDDEVASDEEDEDEKAHRQERQQALAEVEETKKEIAEYEERYKKQTNQLLKMKIKGALDKLKADLQVKLSGLGIEEDE